MIPRAATRRISRSSSFLFLETKSIWMAARANAGKNAMFDFAKRIVPNQDD